MNKDIKNVAELEGGIRENGHILGRRWSYNG